MARERDRSADRNRRRLGRIYTGKVVRIADFGAFVEILPNMDGMVHISQLDSERVNKVEDVVNMGDEMTVMVTDIDPTARSASPARPCSKAGRWKKPRKGPRRARGGGGDRGGRPGGDRGGDRGGNRYGGNRR